MFKILSINPGSTSTKISIYEDEKKLFEETINHDEKDLNKFENIQSQFDLRKNALLNFLDKNNFKLSDLDAIVSRGGVLPPLKSGAYRINSIMVDYLINTPRDHHASNLGAVIAYNLSENLNIPSYIYDPISVDELEDVARISGLPEIERESRMHALNMRASAIKASKELNKKYEDSRFVVAHLGGGTTLSVHKKGKIVDILSDDEGPFSPERSGGVPGRNLVDLCFSGKYTKDKIKKNMRSKSGLEGYLKTKDLRKVEELIEKGDKKAKLIFEAMVYQIAKGIGQLATVLDGDLDAVVITGGMAFSKKLEKMLKKKISFLGEVIMLPGEEEMEALTLGGLRVLKGEEEAKEFTIE
jgi:butyrate kinase